MVYLCRSTRLVPRDSHRHCIGRVALFKGHSYRESPAVPRSIILCVNFYCRKMVYLCRSTRLVPRDSPALYRASRTIEGGQLSGVPRRTTIDHHVCVVCSRQTFIVFSCFTSQPGVYKVPACRSSTAINSGTCSYEYMIRDIV